MNKTFMRERELKYGIKGELGGERVELHRQTQRLSNPTTMTLSSFVIHCHCHCHLTVSLNYLDFSTACFNLKGRLGLSLVSLDVGFVLW